MNKIWYLSTCDTCKRIINELDLKNKNFEFIDIKNNPISKQDLELIHNTNGLSYEELFNKRAQKYKGLQFTTDEQFKQAILREYTFLKRPIIQIGNQLFVGNGKKVIEETKEILK